MLISASSEFIALAKEQIALLSHCLGASLCVVYLTEELVEATAKEAKLIPVVVYPETAVVREGAIGLALPNFHQKLLAGTQDSTSSSKESETQEASKPHSTDEYVLSGDQVVLPLIYENVMMGLLVTAREDRAWNEQERSSIQNIAQTLVFACILDQRRAWLQQQLHQQQILQEKQQDLLDNLLHQFRNPLTALRTFGKLLLKRLQPKDANREVAASIVRESDRLEEFLEKFDQVIDLTVEDLEPYLLPQKDAFVKTTVPRPEPMLLLPGAGEAQINCLIVDILEPLLVWAKAIALERNLQIITKIPPNNPPVWVHVKALREVLSNIIDNALKYTPPGGKIFIESGLEKDNFQAVTIADTGPGIPAQDLEHLGERHYRGVQAQTEIPGTGLGLAIAKQLVEQMHGEIQIQSPAFKSTTSPLAPGTKFTIWLPESRS